jgi:hypothetical protein
MVEFFLATYEQFSEEDILESPEMPILSMGKSLSEVKEYSLDQAEDTFYIYRVGIEEEDMITVLYSTFTGDVPVYSIQVLKEIDSYTPRDEEADDEEGYEEDYEDDE